MRRFRRFLIICFVLSVIFAAKSNFLLANDAYFLYDSKNKRDPFESLLDKNVKVTDIKYLESLSQIVVEGVIVDPRNGSAAILNGNVLKVGEFIGGFRLEKVTNYEVHVSRDGKIHKLVFRDRSYEQ